MKKALFLFALLLFLLPEVYAQTVYITKTGAKYHSSGCQYLRRSSTPIDLKEAVERGYTPCSRCNPPTLQTQKSETKKQEVNKKESSTVPKSNDTGRKRCKAITKKGTQCKRYAEPGSDYCWQHKK